MMGIIQLVLADWPVSIIETASVLVKRKLYMYTCTYSYMISIFVFLLDRVNTIINSLKCYLCLHDLSYCRIHVSINQMVQRSLWFIIWGGEMVQYEHDLNYRQCILYISTFKKPLIQWKKKALIEGMFNWHGNAQTALLFVYHMHQRHRRPLSTN